jgi:catalase
MNESQTSANKPPLLRLVLVAAIVGSVALLFLYQAGYFSSAKLTPKKIIDRFEQVNGEHPGFRRNHSKGVGIRGTFESNGRGVTISKAAVFAAGRVPVIGRFALAAAQPYVTDAPHTVRSLALLFQLPDGEEWRTGMNNIPVFVVNTAQAFYDLLLASAPVPATGKPDPAKMSAFLAAHPASAKALPLVLGQPATSGFADSTYNSLNAFRFINTQGVVTSVRWSMVPVQPVKLFDTAATNHTGTNFLFDDLIAAVHQHPLRWKLIVTLAQPGDPTTDATVAWPTNREQIELGTLTIDQVESEDTSPARDINFDPLILPSGIAPSDDPLLSARSAAYAKSFTRREGETKTPSAVSPAETAK